MAGRFRLHLSIDLAGIERIVFSFEAKRIDAWFGVFGV